MFVLWTLVVFILESENWQWFPRLHATIHHDWSRAVMYMYPERGRIAEMHHDRDTFEFSQGHVTRNQESAVPV